MKGYLVLLALVGLSAGAPQNWPYRDSLMPYRYGYPSQSQYKYLPQIEDDEDVGPYPGSARQDFVVGSDGDRVRPTQQAAVAPGVVETGSVAPVVDATQTPATVPTAASSPAAPPPRPVGPSESAGAGKPVQPPPFPPARPPPTPPPKEEEEDEDDDESDEEADDEDDDETPEQGGDDEDGDDNDDEHEDEEERRRQEPLSAEDNVESPAQPPAVAQAKPVAPAPVVVDPVPIKNKTVVPDSVEEVNAPPSVESNEVVKPAETDDDSSEEQGLGDGVEALVPGYVTDQGEVLVPVDTVTGDQPISIVPDPYTPPTRGVQIPNYRYQNTNPYYYSDIYGDEIGRQGSYFF